MENWTIRVNSETELENEGFVYILCKYYAVFLLNIHRKLNNHSKYRIHSEIKLKNEGFLYILWEISAFVHAQFEYFTTTCMWSQYELWNYAGTHKKLINFSPLPTEKYVFYFSLIFEFLYLLEESSKSNTWDMTSQMSMLVHKLILNKQLSKMKKVNWYQSKYIRVDQKQESIKNLSYISSFEQME